jgi:hypothetical protein
MRALFAAVCLLGATTTGAHEARYLVRGAQLPVEVAVNGYVQSVTPGPDGEVLVKVTAPPVPVDSEGSYGGMDHLEAELPGGFEIPKTLRRELRPELQAFEVATGILRWVAVHLRIDEGRGPQDAASVIARRAGRCSGVANATAALLVASGFEARTVSGLLVTEEGPVPHRWVECRLPRAGWVATDPTLGLWAMTSRHLAFVDTVTEIPELEVIQAGGGELEMLPRWRGRPTRPNSGAGLVCRLIGEGEPERAVAVLYGRGGEVRRAILAPEGHFEALLPGRWRLVVVADGKILEQRDLELAPSQTHSFAVSRSRAEPKQEVGS